MSAASIRPPRQGREEALRAAVVSFAGLSYPTTSERPCPTRVTVMFQRKARQAALDQIRAVDRQRLICLRWLRCSADRN
jgi:hypothetical protein